MADDNHTLIVEELNSLVILPNAHPASEQLRDKLEEAMRRHVAEACARLVETTCASGDDSVWLIRNLDLNLVLNLDKMDEVQIARLWGHRIATEIVYTLARGPEGDDILYFPNWAAYLARFLGDVAEGAAWSKWYYESFDSLRSLPNGAAIQTALAREPEHAEAALLQLAEDGRLERVLNALSQGDAQRIVTQCLTVGTGGDYRASIMAALGVWETAALSTFPSGLATMSNVLRLYVAVRRNTSTSAEGLSTALQGLLGFADVLAQVPAPEELAELLARNDLRGAMAMARDAGLRAHLESVAFVYQTAGSDGDWLRRVADTVTPKSRSETLPLPAPRRFLTLFGGLFLLLPSLLDLDPIGLLEATSYPDQKEKDAAYTLFSLLLIKCLGRSRAREARYDPVVSLLIGDEGGSETLDAEGEATLVTSARALFRRLLARLRDHRILEGRCLAVEYGALGDTNTRVLLIRDTARDVWVYMKALNEGTENVHPALAEGLEWLRAAVGLQPEFLLLGEGVGLDAVEAWPGGILLMESEGTADMPVDLGTDRDGTLLTLWTRAETSVPETLRSALASYLQRARPLETEGAYLTLLGLYPPLLTNSSLDLTLSLMAHAVLKGFARRVMGFEWSGANYLFENFLAGTSAVELEEERITVRLPRTPLHIVLQMAGMYGQTLVVPWLGEQRIELMLQE